MSESKPVKIYDPQIACYIHYYHKDGELKKMFVPVQLKDVFMERFGDDLLKANEDDFIDFIKDSEL